MTALLLLTGAAGAQDSLRLDTRVVQGAQPDAAGPVSTASPLVAGQTYFAVVSGTASIWSVKQWSTTASPPLCGAPESAPMFPSPGVANGPVGWDPETVFAVPPGTSFNDFVCNTDSIPFDSIAHSTGGFQIDLGHGFFHVEPIGGPFTTPRADHTYTYMLPGAGAPASFRFQDFPIVGNYGVFRVDVMTADECAAVSCTTVTPPAQTQAPSTGRLGSTVIRLPSSTSCDSRRHFRVHFFVNRGVKIASLSVFVNRRLVRKLTGALSTFADLRGLPKGAFVLDMRGVTTRGQVLADQRRYHTCRVRLPSRRKNFHAHPV